GYTCRTDEKTQSYPSSEEKIVSSGTKVSEEDIEPPPSSLYNQPLQNFQFMKNTPSIDEDIVSQGNKRGIVDTDYLNEYEEIFIEEEITEEAFKILCQTTEEDGKHFERMRRSSEEEKALIRVLFRIRRPRINVNIEEMDYSTSSTEDDSSSVSSELSHGQSSELSDDQSVESSEASEDENCSQLFIMEPYILDIRKDPLYTLCRRGRKDSRIDLVKELVLHESYADESKKYCWIENESEQECETSCEDEDESEDEDTEDDSTQYQHQRLPDDSASHIKTRMKVDRISESNEMQIDILRKSKRHVNS
uniref:Uncharacterized protein n=1 Tax=Clytia hemisphaerica TaxID=252671 RepID=A0A7M5X182_9CNID